MKTIRHKLTDPRLPSDIEVTTYIPNAKERAAAIKRDAERARLSKLTWLDRQLERYSEDIRLLLSDCGVRDWRSKYEGREYREPYMLTWQRETDYYY